ncbi:MAG: DUF362 domain-containing protein [Acidobacteria bacterium]|nr:DUF362 domain-containing protein [Acidobacteriota bacterium]
MFSRRALLAGSALFAQTSKPTVAIQRCRTYGHGLDPTLRRLFDGVGGLPRLVKGKAVAIKIHLEGPGGPWHWPNPELLRVTLLLLAEAGAARLTVFTMRRPASPLMAVWPSGTEFRVLRRQPAGSVLVSFAKMLEHSKTGLALSMRNATDGTTPREVANAPPIHLSILDGVETLAGGEGPWIAGTRPCQPGFVIAGTNPVHADAVAAAALGFNPLAPRGTPPFEDCDNFLELAAERGERDPARIEVAGAQIADIRYFIRKA